MANDNKSDIRRNFRYPVEFGEFFPVGLYQIGDVRPDLEYTGNPDRPGPQKRDEQTGQLVWKIPVTDPNEPNPRRASYEVLLLSDTEPEPTTQEIAPGMRPVALTGLTVQPRVGGQGEFKYLTQTVRASGYATPPGSGSRSAGGSGTGKSPA
ncbi:hypothetical protein ACIBJI_35120 [Nocardia sp. NPDC050408]|uniref:hypothetical protein n=1 Tax=Nocardia sp. NPDC050408 TaxID=3364319 RepID=UPI0037B8151B